MKTKCIALVLAGIMFVTPALAFVFEIQPKTKSEIANFTDDQLVEEFIEVTVEKDASATFHETSGFAPKEYQLLKKLLKYRLLLLFEIHKRRIDVPTSLN